MDASNRLVNPIEEIYYNKTTKYTSKWSHYFSIYDTWFRRFINQNPKVLEIGVDNGGSMQMWKQYFSNPSLFGIDNRPKFEFDNPVEYLGFDANLIVGDQGDSEFWDYFVSNTPKLDVVIDDGSHFQNHQLLTMEKLWPHMNEGGIYMVEDTHSSYMKIFNGAYKGNTFVSTMKDVVDALHVDHMEDVAVNITNQFNNEPFRSIKAIHFYDSVVVVEKGLRPKHNVTYSNRESAV